MADDTPHRNLITPLLVSTRKLPPIRSIRKYICIFLSLMAAGGGGIIEEHHEMYEEAEPITEMDAELEAILVIACVCKLPPSNNLSASRTTADVPRPGNEKRERERKKDKRARKTKPFREPSIPK